MNADHEFNRSMQYIWWLVRLRVIIRMLLLAFA